MAIQRFLDGGYTGKLGVTVGQRLGATLYIRQYVVPDDPRTPGQVAHRAMFAKASALTLQAMDLNKGANYWKNGKLNEQQARMKTAYARLKAGLPDGEALPLYPDGYTANTPIGGFTASFNQSLGLVSFSSTSPILDENRQFYILIRFKNRDTGVWQTFEVSTVITGGATWAFAFRRGAQMTFPDGSWVESATGDDNEHSGNAVSLMRSFFQESNIKGENG